jgi:hypothetical protein
LALLRLAENAENPEATEVLLRENRCVIEAVVNETLGTQDEAKMLAHVLERIGHKAPYYDPEENPVVWLQECLRLECRRWNAEKRSNQAPTYWKADAVQQGSKTGVKAQAVERRIDFNIANAAAVFEDAV